MRVFFTKNRDEHIGARDFFFAIACGLHMHDGALNHPLETQRRLRIDFIVTRHLRGVVFDEVRQ